MFPLFNILYFHYIRCKRTMELGGERLGVNLDLVETKTFFLQSTFSLLSTSFHAAWFSADLYSACNCDRRLRADNLQVEGRRGGLAGGREWMCAKKCVFVSSRQWFAKAGSLVLCYCYRDLGGVLREHCLLNIFESLDVLSLALGSMTIDQQFVVRENV